VDEDLLYKIGADTAKFDKSMGGVISMLKTAAIGFIGFGSAGAALKFITEEALKNEKATMGLASAVKSLKTSTEAGFLSLNKYAMEMSEHTGIAVGDLKDALKELVYSTGSTDAAQKSLAATLDLAKAKNLSYEQAAKLVGKAYEGNSAMLKRYGIEIDAHAKGMTVINELTKKFGGAEDSYLQTTQGKLDKAKNSVNLLANELGQSLLPALGDAANAVTKFLHSFTPEGQEEGIKKQIKALEDSKSTLESGMDYYKRFGGASLDTSFKEMELQKKIDAVNKSLAEQKKKLIELGPELDAVAIKTYAAAKGSEAESDAAEASDKDKLDSAREFFGGMSSLSKTKNKELFEIGKGAAMANIVVSTAEAIMNAMAKIPPPFNIAAAAGVGVAGAVELAAASGAAFNPKGAAEGVWDWRASGNNENLVTTINHNEAIISKPQAANMGSHTTNNFNIPMLIPDSAGMDRVIRELIQPALDRVATSRGQ
jgi:hypothetical protein